MESEERSQGGGENTMHSATRETYCDSVRDRVWHHSHYDYRCPASLSDN